MDPNNDPGGKLRKAGDPVRDPYDSMRAENAESALETLRAVAERLAGLHGRRKAILFVSEGVDYDIDQPGATAEDIKSAMREVVASASRAEVCIYGIDPRGLTDLGAQEVEVRAYPTDPVLDVNRTSLTDELRMSQASLRELSDPTGGFAMVNRNDLATAYDRIVRDSSSYYLLAYHPPSDKRNGTFHTIDVRVTRPGLTVRARKSYVSSKGKAAVKDDAPSDVAPAARNALNSPVPVSGLTLNVFSAPFKGTGGAASVLLGTEVRGSDLKLDSDRIVDLSYFAVDAKGNVLGAKTSNLTLNLNAETRRRIGQSGVRIFSRLNLAPGRYQLHVAANDGQGGNVGSVICDLDVPDFSRGSLLMSGLVVTSLSGSQMPTAQADERLYAVLPDPPSARREFPPDDEVAVFAEFYDNENKTPHQVEIETKVTSDAGNIVYKATEERAAEELQGERGYGYMSRIPLQDLAPGRYVLRIEGRSHLDPGVSVSREVQFEVGAPNQTLDR